MMRTLTLILILISTTLSAFSQSKTDDIYTETIEVDGKKRELQVLYKYKTDDEGIKSLRVKFKNKTKSTLTIDLTLGIYSNGVLLEKSNIADCLKKSSSDNITRPVHIVQSDAFTRDDIKIEVLNLITESIDECRETHSE